MRASGRSRAPAFLDRLGLTLEENYHKRDYDELSRLDARNLIDALTSSLEQLDDEISCGLITVAPQSRPSDEAQRAAENKPRLTRKRCSGRVRCRASLGVVPWSHSTRRIVVLRVRPTEVVIEVAATGRSNINVL
jgi:hypothetical protein